jgi:hypothetical protein
MVLFDDNSKLAVEPYEASVQDLLEKSWHHGECIPPYECKRCRGKTKTRWFRTLHGYEKHVKDEH